MSSIYFCIGLLAGLFTILGMMLNKCLEDTPIRLDRIVWLTLLVLVVIREIVDLIKMALSGL